MLTAELPIIFTSFLCFHIFIQQHVWQIQIWNILVNKKNILFASYIGAPVGGDKWVNCLNQFLNQQFNSLLNHSFSWFVQNTDSFILEDATVVWNSLGKKINMWTRKHTKKLEILCLQCKLPSINRLFVELLYCMETVILALSTGKTFLQTIIMFIILCGDISGAERIDLTFKFRQKNLYCLCVGWGGERERDRKITVMIWLLSSLWRPLKCDSCGHVL